MTLSLLHKGGNSNNCKMDYVHGDYMYDVKPYLRDEVVSGRFSLAT